MKYINKIKTTVLLLLVTSVIYAQPKQKVDGVVAVVGDYVVLDSDIDLEFIQLKAQNVDISKISRCELFGKQLEDKLFAHQAIQDSIIVTDAEVNSIMEGQLEQMMAQTGSLDDVVKFYRKKNVEEFKAYFAEQIKQNKLTSEMQNKITDEVQITPEEVRNFFKDLTEDERPVFGAEVEVAQLVVKPEVSEQSKNEVIEKLNKIRTDVVENGSSFFSKAVLFSEDPGSSSNGGYYKMNRKTPFVKEFKDVAFSLAEGEISQPFETDFGYHIIYVEKIKGQDIELRHILIAPKITTEAMNNAKKKIEDIRVKIISKEISFADAARASSDEKETKNNGGVLLNPRTLEPSFELTKMDPSLYAQVSELAVGSVSQPITETAQGGGLFYKIITVNKKTEEHTSDYSRDYLKIKELALKDKKVKAVAKWVDEKIGETYINLAKDYKDCDFNYNWTKTTN